MDKHAAFLALQDANYKQCWVSPNFWQWNYDISDTDPFRVFQDLERAGSGWPRSASLKAAMDAFNTPMSLSVVDDLMMCTYVKS
jgi:hypothetical protein